LNIIIYRKVQMQTKILTIEDEDAEKISRQPHTMNLI